MSIFVIQNKNKYTDYLSFQLHRKKYSNKEIEVVSKNFSTNSIFSENTYICYNLEYIDFDKCLKTIGKSKMIIFSSFDDSYKFPKDVKVVYSKALNKESILGLIQEICKEYSIDRTNEDEIYQGLKKYISNIPEEYLINSIHVSLISNLPFDKIFSKSSKEYEILLNFLDQFYQYLLDPIPQNEDYYKCIKCWFSIDKDSRIKIIENSLQYLIKSSLISDSTTDYFEKKIKKYDSIKNSKIMKMSIELSKLLSTFENSESLGIQKFLTNLGSK